MKREPRCPDCGWTLEFRIERDGGPFPDSSWPLWEAYCWNPNCQRSRVDANDAVFRAES